MTECNCKEILKGVESIFESEKKLYESAMEDGTFWAAMVAEGSVDRLDEYLQTHEISLCGCEDYQRLDSVDKVIEECKNKLKQTKNEISQRTIKRTAFTLLDKICAGEDISEYLD